MATRGMYVLESAWAWDNHNTEYATFTVEEPNHGFERLLNPDCPEGSRRATVERLKRVANEQNDGALGNARLVRLWRVIGFNGKHPHVIEEKYVGIVDLLFRLEPVCEFDADGNPVNVRVK